MANWNDILSENEEQLTEEELLKYIDENISQEEKYLIEKKIGEGAFEMEAAQGLSQVENKQRLQKHINQLNQDLHQLTGKKLRKEKQEIKIFDWIILAVLILLFICIVGYLIISLQNRSHVTGSVVTLNSSSAFCFDIFNWILSFF